ncbi:hypothetical protein HNR44_003221 [Geomicrobium halophilum]|uniref:Uncharacterized protein n=1 Tax=Geomicrobium halophilum TaxID=549000 RepID=A0A841PQR8_9BACL|nr:hypothetical protein [Geomicrobium halophilum]MBB6451227.1 hypothetical protein [Geomicrobium halophilum]
MFDKVTLMLKWMPYKNQYMCERKLMKIMERLKIDDFNFNWDRNSCFIEIRYQEKSYRMEHSVQQAKKKGILLKNGLDCLVELIHSLEDLCEIIDRGTYNLETWISGMNQSSSVEEEMPEYQEEFHIRYKSTGEQKPLGYNRSKEDFIHLAPESSLGNFDRSEFPQNYQRK